MLIVNIYEFEKFVPKVSEPKSNRRLLAVASPLRTKSLGYKLTLSTTDICWHVQTVWTPIRPDKSSGLTWIHPLWHLWWYSGKNLILGGGEISSRQKACMQWVYSVASIYHRHSHIERGTAPVLNLPSLRKAAFTNPYYEVLLAQHIFSQKFQTLLLHKSRNWGEVDLFVNLCYCP